MTRARILADYVSSGDELALKAPLASPAFTGSPSITLGSDATGDVYYRAAGGALTRLATGADGTVLTSTGAAAVPAFEAVPAGGVDGITSSADANAINIDSSERVIMKAQPMMLATGTGGTNQGLTTSFAPLTILSETATDCFIRGIGFTGATGVATFPIAGRYFILLKPYFAVSDGHTIESKFVFSNREDRNCQWRAGQTTSMTFSGIFDCAADTTLTFQVCNHSGTSGTISNGVNTLLASILYVGE